MITRTQIVAEARSWIGTKYQHQARLKGVAVDCIGLIGGVALTLGIPGAKEWKADPTLHSYAKQPDPAMLLRACDRFLDERNRYDAAPGDIFVMRFAVDPMHFAIMSDAAPMRIIHAYAIARRVAEHVVDYDWQSRIVRAYSFRGIV